MLIAARNAMMAGKRLPYDAEVEYLESTGTQWIDVGFSPYGRTPIARVDFALQDQANQLEGIFGSWASNDRRLQILKTFANYQGNLGIGTSVNYTLIRYRRYDITLNSDTKTALVNGSTISGFNTDNGFGDYSLYLFWRNNNNNDGTRPAFMRCYACQIWDGSILVRDFIPVRFTNEQGVSEGAMYDKRGVGGMNPDGSARDDRLYRNRGTGAFVIGPDK